MVNKGIQHVATQELKCECMKKKKTAKLNFAAGVQDYLKKLYPSHAKIILKARCKTLDIKTHNSYKFDEDDVICRMCGLHEETLEHIVNCGRDEILQVNIEEIDLSDDLSVVEVSRYAGRIIDFLEHVED